MNCQGRCDKCLKRSVCSLPRFVELTLPWAHEAAQSSGDEWTRSHNVARALRGSGPSPGFTEDARMEGALTLDDVRETVTAITRKKTADMGTLIGNCRNYVGP
jgi:hypothetical protein